MRADILSAHSCGGSHGFGPDWVILTVFVFVWGLPPVKAFLNGLFAPAFPIGGLHNLIQKVPPVVPTPHLESAVYTLNLLSATGTGILLSAIVGARRPDQVDQLVGAGDWQLPESVISQVEGLLPKAL